MGACTSPDHHGDDPVVVTIENRVELCHACVTSALESAHRLAAAVGELVAPERVQAWPPAPSWTPTAIVDRARLGDVAAAARGVRGIS